MNNFPLPVTEEIKHWKAVGIVPAFFGLGFVQLKLSKLHRLHFYHPEANPIAHYQEEPHDHRYHFHSRVLAGELRQESYAFTADENGAWLKTLETCQPGVEAPVGSDTLGKVEKIAKMRHYADDEYFCHEQTFHTVTTGPDGWAITDLTRTDYTKQFAHVLRLKTGEKTCPFSQPKSEDWCWEIIADCLKRGQAMQNFYQKQHD